MYKFNHHSTVQLNPVKLMFHFKSLFMHGPLKECSLDVLLHFYSAEEDVELL